MLKLLSKIKIFLWYYVIVLKLDELSELFIYSYIYANTYNVYLSIMFIISGCLLYLFKRAYVFLNVFINDIYIFV